MSRTLFVDQGSTATGADGKISHPYPTIQAAINAAAALQSSALDPITIAIWQGNYPEKVFIGIDGLCLRGLGGVTKINPPTGPAIVVTNATSASVDQYIAGNDPHVLVRTGNSPHTLRLIDLTLEPLDQDAAAIYVLGAPASPQHLGDSGIFLDRCNLYPTSERGVVAYFCDYLYVRQSSEVIGRSDVFNCGGIYVEDSAMADITMTWDPAHDLKAPAGITAVGLVGKNAVVEGTTTLKGAATYTGQPTIDSSFTTLNLQGSSCLAMQGGYIGAALSVDGNATWLAQNVHVQGNLAFAAGTGKARLDGGSYIGTVKDPNGRFVRNPGK